jgi:hypothetical protein
MLLLGATAPAPSDPSFGPAVVRPATPNPPIAEACGIDVTLILDASGSIQSAGAVDDVREAAEAFLTALADTSSTARVIDFGTNARQTAPRTVVTTASLAPGGVFANAIAAYYNPIPPYPPGVSGHAYRGGNRPVDQASSFTNGSSTQYTNWDDGLNRAASSAQQLVVFVTDGQPNAVVDDHPGDPFFRAGDSTPDVRYALEGNNQADDLSLDRGVEEANRIKTANGRMLAVGVGDAFDGPAPVSRLRAVTNGPTSNVVTSAGDITDLNEVDVALISDFDALADALRAVVTQLCSPSLTIQKLAQSAESAAYEPAAGWSMTVSPAVTGAGSPPYRWILPVPNAPVGPQTTTTDANGFAQFQWEPNPPTASSIATVTEVDQDGFTPLDWSCRAKNPNGSVIETGGTFTSAPTFTVAVGPEQIVTCTVRNDFDYEPSGVVTKVNSPVIVRGDGDGTAVTSTYTAENTGNTPLSPVAGNDTKCAPVDYVRLPDGRISGDDDDDELVDPGEIWVLECTRTIQHALTDGEIVIPNTVTLSGRAPDGTVVSGDATDEIQVLTPDITIVKTVAPTTGVAPLDVTYTYEVSTNGNTPLADVTLEDDTAPCSDPDARTFVGGDTTNTGYLDPGETWTYTCDADDLTAGVVNTASVSGQPVTPVDPDVDADPLTPIGDPVEASDGAEVTVETADLALVKSASPLIGFPGTDITYTFLVTNPSTATAILVPQGAIDDVVTDDLCPGVTFQDGDTGTPGVMSPGETWEYSCVRDYDSAGLKRNTATATMQVQTIGTVLTRTDPASVLIVAPVVHLEKRPDRGTVYDGDSVTYFYEATNPGIVSLEDVSVTDDAGPGTCSPVDFQGGDEDGDDELDPGELWEYTCTTPVSKTAASTEPETIPNTATVTGTPVIGSLIGAPVSDDADGEVIVIDPSIDLTKSVDPTEVRLPGGDATWTVVATNDGDSPLYNVVVDDDNCSPMLYQSGDVDDDGIMPPGEVWTYTCVGFVGTDTVNTATVVATDVLGGTVDNVANAEITTFEAAIDLVKTVSEELVLSGTTVIYEYVATNIGTDPLHDVALTDDTCSPLSAPSGDTGGDGIMDPGEDWTYTCDQAITVRTTNTAVVTGLDHTDTEVTAAAHATVVPFTTGIQVVKTASPTILYGPGTVTYRYEVTNTGNVPLADVAARIDDDTCAPVDYVSGDDDANDLLTGVDDLFETGPPETWIFTCTMTISEDTTNTVLVTGTPVRPDEPDPVIAPDVTADDTATAQVLPTASIVIEKRTQGGRDGTFDFAGDLGDFEITTVAATGSQTLDDLQPGTYVVEELTSLSWSLTSLTCDDPTTDTTIERRTATITVDSGETVTCTWTNGPTPVAPITSTLEAIIDHVPPMDPLRMIVLVITGAAGAAVVLWAQRRRRIRG